MVRRGRGFGILVVLEAGEGGIGQAGGMAGLCMGEALAFAFEDQFGIVDELHAMRLGELLGTVADEVDVGAFFEDEARGVDGIAQALDAGDTAGFHAASVHEEGVKLYATVGGEEAASTGVEGRIVFEDGDGGFDGINGCAATGEDFVTDFEGVTHAGFVGGRGIGRDGPCASVNEEGGIVRGWESVHPSMVVHLRRR